MNAAQPPLADADLAAVGAVLAEPARAKILLALADGRSLPASVLAGEAGVAAPTASHHLTRLADAGLITVTTRGRYRYFTLAGPHVGALIEAVARVAPAQPVTSARPLPPTRLDHPQAEQPGRPDHPGLTQLTELGVTLPENELPGRLASQ